VGLPVFKTGVGLSKASVGFDSHSLSPFFMSEVILENICKRYENGSLAVNNVSLTVRDGEFLVLVGPSGCGKSTTLRMVAGLEEMTSGAIYIGGRCVNDLPPKDRDIAMVFQNYALYPHMTVFENMAFGLRLRRVPRREIQARVNEAAEILGLQEYLTRLPKQLSGGQRQRVAVGRAIVRKPKVFLFDEPLSNLDAKMRVEMRGELMRLHQRLGATMIYVTHDQVEAMTMSDRVVVMDKGVVQQCDSPLAVYRRPANLFVAGFVGTPPMNVVKDGSRIMGFRPESLTLCDPADRGAPLKGIVDVVEPMGAETYIHFITPGKERLIARVAPDVTLRAGDPVAFSIQSGQACFFDVTGRRIEET
jgi:multiple sugar transport system ATP-binding protein